MAFKSVFKTLRNVTVADNFIGSKMRLNDKTIIEGNGVLLVPYEKHHVEKYHNWMKSPELQTMTASEPLSLDEEYKMQISWREDSDIKYNETKDEIEAMIGDTNIFLKDDIETAEIEIMIAESSARGKGHGKEAVLLMMRYGINHLKIKTYRAIILVDNTKSISLFESLGFTKVEENKIFNEIIFEKKITDEWVEWVKSQTDMYHEKVRN